LWCLWKLADWCYQNAGRSITNPTFIARIKCRFGHGANSQKANSLSCIVVWTLDHHNGENHHAATVPFIMKNKWRTMFFKSSWETKLPIQRDLIIWAWIEWDVLQGWIFYSYSYSSGHAWRQHYKTLQRLTI
jgi:hypothetical protein